MRVRIQKFFAFSSLLSVLYFASECTPLCSTESPSFAVSIQMTSGICHRNVALGSDPQCSWDTGSVKSTEYTRLSISPNCFISYFCPSEYDLRPKSQADLAKITGLSFKTEERLVSLKSIRILI
ncbi:hypothetical protein CH373_06525 [Leptospira perolatii]|uniref:Lipoprotein n=1 Tax=Leptospira perolatii TaxID=2023191 RepID=A0A2M9ZPB7_9LEPT|nr:hypothetical protein CH360_03385 [Leptospira perolatii]PJZ73809.1 hypothetical protein CH373_06525 [Leptospira perolatii]